MLMKTLQSIRQYSVAVWALYCLFISPMVMAEDGENLEFIGTIIVPPACSLNEDKTIEISFGDNVGVKKVASGIYREPIPLNLECGQNSHGWQLMLSVYGTEAGFDEDKATVVTSEKSVLGVKLFADGQAFTLDKAIKINGTNLPEIEAVLVQRNGVELTEGAFTAKATLRAEYQ